MQLTVKALIVFETHQAGETVSAVARRGKTANGRPEWDRGQSRP
jgi:hypothetical protein